MKTTQIRRISLKRICMMCKYIKRNTFIEYTVILFGLFYNFIYQYLWFQYDNDYLISKNVYYLQCNISIVHIHKKYENNLHCSSIVELKYLFLCSGCDNRAFEGDSSDSDVPLAELVKKNKWQVFWTKRLSELWPDYIYQKLWNIWICFLLPWFQLLLMKFNK